jgi:two-component system cell cycle sensor histidine kinase/response regulator CckA
MTNPIGGEKNLDPQSHATPPSLAEFDLLLNLYRTLIESSDLTAGVGSALATVCGLAGWDIGLAWLPNKHQSAIEFFSSWHGNDAALTEFAQFCQHQSFAPGVGITGRVWQRGEPEWTRPLADQPPELFPLAPSAAKAGIKATLAVPVNLDGHVLCVLVFCTRQVKEEDDRLVQMVSRVATQLGFALRHKQIEESLRHQEALLRRSRDELEISVSQRTVQLTIANEALQAEIFERKRLQEEMLSRVRQQESVVHIGERALSGLELPLLLQEACERVANTVDVEFCKVLELQPSAQTLLLKAGVGWRDGLVGQAIVPTGMGSQAGYTLTSKKPIIVEDLRVENRFNGPSLLVDHGVVSGMSVVIPGRDRPYGVLGAHTAKRRIFRNEDLHFLESVAHILSRAIERKDAETAIRRSENWLRSLVATTQDAVVSIDRRGRIVLFNAAAERIFGYTAAEIAGRKVNDLMAEPYASEHDDYIARYEKSGEARAIGRIRTVTGRRKNGELFPIELSVTEIEVDDQVHYAAFLRDISSTVDLYTRAVENERLAAIGSTAAKIGHEIANPLNGIYLTLQLVEQRLARQPSADERVTTDIARIKKEIGRLNQLVQEFRALSRQQTFDFRPIRLNELIDEVFELQQPLCDAGAIRVVCHIPTGPPPIGVDEDKLKQALLNLFKNAIEAMPNGGDLGVEVSHSDDEVVIKISDTGLGIAPGADIFAPFYTTKKEGTGLGLIIVRQIIAAHEGTITFKSEPGKGTTFTITLPFKRATKESAKDSK